MAKHQPSSPKELKPDAVHLGEKSKKRKSERVIHSRLVGV
jgi:hypothetical protein